MGWILRIAVCPIGVVKPVHVNPCLEVSGSAPDWVPPRPSFRSPFSYGFKPERVRTYRIGDFNPGSSIVSSPEREPPDPERRTPFVFSLNHRTKYNER